MNLTRENSLEWPLEPETTVTGDADIAYGDKICLNSNWYQTQVGITAEHEDDSEEIKGDIIIILFLLFSFYYSYIILYSFYYFIPTVDA